MRDLCQLRHNNNTVSPLTSHTETMKISFRKSFHATNSLDLTPIEAFQNTNDSSHNDIFVSDDDIQLISRRLSPQAQTSSSTIVMSQSLMQ